MTKVQMKNEVLAALSSHKANKGLTTAITELLEQYASKASKGAEKRAKLITVDGVDYIWCNRHEMYEVSNNFKTEKSDCCKLGHVVWVYYGRLVKEAQEELDILLAADDMDVVAIKAANNELKSIKELRGGRYNFDENELQFPEVEMYNYDRDLHRLS